MRFDEVNETCVTSRTSGRSGAKVSVVADRQVTALFPMDCESLGRERVFFQEIKIGCADKTFDLEGVMSAEEVPPVDLVVLWVVSGHQRDA